jgi:hypothetical protein
MGLTMTKLDIHKKHLKPKCDSSSKNETLKFLGRKCEDPWKPRIKGILAWNSWVELINGVLELAPCYSHGIPNTLIGAILNIGNWVHQLEVQCMSLFDQTKPHSNPCENSFMQTTKPSCHSSCSLKYCPVVVGKKLTTWSCLSLWYIMGAGFF